MQLTNFEELVLEFRWIVIVELVVLHYLFVPIAKHPVIAVEGGFILSFFACNLMLL